MEKGNAWGSTRTLRVLVVAELIVGILYIVVSFFPDTFLPDALAAYEKAQAEADMTLLEWACLMLGLPILVVYLAAAGGLLALWRPARTLYLVTTVATIFATLVAGPNVESALAAALNEGALVLSGLILGLLYASPLRVHFDKPGPPAAGGPA